MQRAGSERRATGRNAQTLKYDILTALGAHGCAGDKHLQRLVLRLMTLVVARYNWAADELAVGQREMAGLWSLDERSVKREMARMRAMGWLVVKRPAARGRVAVYGLAVAAILAQTRGDWDRVGSDFVARMTGPEDGTAPLPDAAARGNVIAFPVPGADAGLWARMQAVLCREDAHLYGAWFAGLQGETDDGGTLHLSAPSRFHAAYITGNHLLRLLHLAGQIDPAVVRLEVHAP